MRLSASELAEALAGLSPTEREELLALLTAAEEQSSKGVEDTRVPLEVMAAEALQQAAEASGDPAGYLAADAAHEAAREPHMLRLLAEIPDDLAEDGWCPAFLVAFLESGRLATADGFPPAGDVVHRQVQSVEEAPAPALPRSVVADIEYTRGVERAEKGPTLPARVVHVPPDPLAPFRGTGRSEPPPFADE